MQSQWKSRMTAVAAVLALAVATMVGANATADRRGGPHGRGGMLGSVERGIEQLELAPETRKSVDAILDQARSERRALRDPLRAAHQQMRAALDAESPSADSVLAQADSLGALETQAKKIELQAIIQVRQLLSAEQWQQLRAHEGAGRKCRHDDDEKPA